MAQNMRRKRPLAEAGGMFLSRVNPKRIVDLQNHPIIAQSLHSGSLIEIGGPCQSGKTSVLIDIAARCILPKSAGGRNMNVAFVDCERQFHIDRLIAVLERYLFENPIDPAGREELLTQSLERFHYVAVDTSREFLDVFPLLDETFCRIPIADDSDGRILLVDTINAFYWLDRKSKERAPVNEVHQQYAFRIRRFLAEYNLSAIVSKFIIDSDGGSNENFGNQAPEKADGSSKIAASCQMEWNWRKLVTTSIYLSTMDINGKTFHKAYRDKVVVNFEVHFDGIFYVNL